MSKEKIVVVLGAPDPEMAAIETLARAAGLDPWYALSEADERVHPGNAYQARPRFVSAEVARAVLVECQATVRNEYGAIVPAETLDHHRPGDPGYGQPPEEFLPASSLGQFLAWLARSGLILPRREALGLEVAADTPGPEDRDGDLLWIQDSLTDDWFVIEGKFVYQIPEELALAAAADHCLEAAYRGTCPGVDPDRLLRWRISTRAAFQERPVEVVERDVQAARRTLAEAPRVQIDGLSVADLRPVGTVPEAPEAAARDGRPFLARLRDRDGRWKIVLQAAPPAVVRAFLDGALGLVDRYGDPARGFAGGYEDMRNNTKGGS